MRHLAMQTMLAAAIACLAGYSTASAQGAGVYTNNPYYRSDGYARYDRAPRVYGYYPREAEPDVVLRAPSRPDNCGVYHYWNGERCADARVSPPNLN